MSYNFKFVGFIFAQVTNAEHESSCRKFYGHYRFNGRQPFISPNQIVLENFNAVLVEQTTAEFALNLFNLDDVQAELIDDALSDVVFYDYFSFAFTRTISPARIAW